MKVHDMQPVQCRRTVQLVPALLRTSTTLAESTLFDEATAPIGAIGTAPSLRGLEAPRDVADAIEPVNRAFAFLDLCGFTAFIATRGEYAAIDAISRFRSLTRDLTVRRGVRVASGSATAR